MERTRAVLRTALAIIYILAGCLHIAKASAFMAIMPPWVPFPREVIIVTGICEILGGEGLLLPVVRRLSGIMLAIYAVCVFPANLYHALAHVHVPPLPDSWWYHAPRLLAQPVVVWWALFAGGVISCPFGPHAGAQAPTTRPDGSAPPA